MSRDFAFNIEFHSKTWKFSNSNRGLNWSNQFKKLQKKILIKFRGKLSLLFTKYNRYQEQNKPIFKKNVGFHFLFKLENLEIEMNSC